MKQAPGGEKTMLHASRTLVKQRAHFFSGAQAYIRKRSQLKLD